MNLLVAVFADPGRVREWTPGEWNLVLQGARAAGVLAPLGYLLEDHGLVRACPPAVWTMLVAARHHPAYVLAQIMYELHKVQSALCGLDCELVLLKGAAYAAAGLPFARGRSLRDLDILVARRSLDAVAGALAAAGWESPGLTDYDRRYYHNWMHELPPLSHPHRGVEVDLHHTLLPLTARLHPDPQELLADAVPLPTWGVRILSPPDMLLHSATHLFYDGAIAGGFRDLLDIHGMLLHFGVDPQFWVRLVDRAAALDLGRPLYHAVRYAVLLLASPVPPAALDAIRAFAPAPLTDAALRAVVTRALPPPYPLGKQHRVAAWLLYLRAHWLRMPPGLLVRHLTRKSLMRLQ